MSTPTTMSQCDQAHVFPESCPPSPTINDTISRNQYTILVPQHLSEPPIPPPSFSTMISLNQTRDHTHLDRLTSEFFPVDNCNAQNNMDHIISLERSLLSDYVCCGVRLSDFHALLEHYEEVHIMGLAPNGRRIYTAEVLRSVPRDPAPFSEDSTPSSSRSSSVMSSPLSPTVPLAPGTPASSSEPSRKSSLHIVPVYTPFTPSLPVDPSSPYPEGEITVANIPEVDFSSETYPTIPMDMLSSNTSSDEDEEMSDSAPDSPIPAYIYAPDKKQPIAEIPTNRRRAFDAFVAHLPRSKLGPTRPQKSSARSKQARHASGSRLGKREKAYRCTKNSRCVKSYLNPNGLKYHLEKGTCAFEGEAETELEPLDETDILSVSVMVPSAVQPSSPIAADVPGTNSSGLLGGIQPAAGSFTRRHQRGQSQGREQCFEPPQALPSPVEDSGDRQQPFAPQVVPHSQHNPYPNSASELHESEEALVDRDLHQRPHPQPQEYASYPQGQGQPLPRSLPPPPQLHINTHHPSATAYLPKAGGFAYMPRPQSHYNHGRVDIKSSGYGTSCPPQNDTRVVYAPTPLKAASLIASPRAQ